ncbi:hypothetical protein BDZ89DRAFT_1116101 [Hymenopellis radicata]|nr:hypothetical protein BDZ89DRAFT_1116101 [Hymenopellis radicata]
MSSQAIPSHQFTLVHAESESPDDDTSSADHLEQPAYIRLADDGYPEHPFHCAHTRFHPDLIRNLEYHLGYPAPGMLNLDKHINAGPFGAIFHTPISRDFRHRHPGDAGQSSSSQRFAPYTPKAGPSRPRKRNREVAELQQYTREILEGPERKRKRRVGQKVRSRAAKTQPANAAGPSKSTRSQGSTGAKERDADDV